MPWGMREGVTFPGRSCTHGVGGAHRQELGTSAGTCPRLLGPRLSPHSKGSTGSREPPSLVVEQLRASVSPPSAELVGKGPSELAEGTRCSLIAPGTCWALKEGVQHHFHPGMLQGRTWPGG